MVVMVDEKADKLIQRDKLDELMRIDASFRKASAAYTILLANLIAKEDVTPVERRLLLNIQADLIYKAEVLMEVSPTLRQRAERYLRALRKEVEQ